MDIIPAVVHQLTEEIEFLAAGLKLHQLAQPAHGWEMESANQKSRLDEE